MLKAIRELFYPGKQVKGMNVLKGNCATKARFADFDLWDSIPKQGFQ